MNKLNSLVIEGEVVEFNEDCITLAYDRNTCNAIYVYNFNVLYNVKLIKPKVGDQIRVVGRLQQNVLTDKVYIAAEYIEISNKEEREFISNE